MSEQKRNAPGELSDGKLAEPPAGRGPEERITAGIQEAYGVMPREDQPDDEEGLDMENLHP